MNLQPGPQFCETGDPLESPSQSEILRAESKHTGPNHLGTRGNVTERTRGQSVLRADAY